MYVQPRTLDTIIIQLGLLDISHGKDHANQPSIVPMSFACEEETPNLFQPDTTLYTCPLSSLGDLPKKISFRREVEKQGCAWRI
jgi:hypothetical protein